MQIVPRALPEADASLPRVRLPVERLTLAKRRWRGLAEDGTEFGFDLESPLPDGAAVWQSAAAVYVLAQKYEPVLELPMADCRLSIAAVAARLGWMIGNLHFQIEVTAEVIRVADDPAVRQMFEREGLPYTACKRIFHPLSGGHQH